MGDHLNDVVNHSDDLKVILHMNSSHEICDSLKINEDLRVSIYTPSVYECTKSLGPKH